MTATVTTDTDALLRVDAQLRLATPGSPKSDRLLDRRLELMRRLGSAEASATTTV